MDPIGPDDLHRLPAKVPGRDEILGCVVRDIDEVFSGRSRQAFDQFEGPAMGLAKPLRPLSGRHHVINRLVEPERAYLCKLSFLWPIGDQGSLRLAATGKEARDVFAECDVRRVAAIVGHQRVDEFRRRFDLAPG